MKKNQTYTLFDFDGVIVESFDMVLSVTREFNDPNLTADEFRTWSMGNVHAAQAVKRDPDLQIYSNEPGSFFYRYQQEVLKLKPKEGIEDLIKSLSKHHNLSIVSSSLSDSIQIFLQHYKLDTYFDEVMGVDIHPSKKVKFEKFFSQNGADTTNTLFITDTLGDIKEAKSVELDTIGVTWGFHSKEILEQAQPLAIASSIDELQNALKTVNYL